MASQQQIDSALGMVNAFRERNSSGAWLNVSSVQMADSLEARINNPTLVSSDRTSLCGPAAFIAMVAEDDPEAFARIGIQLYESGTTVLSGKGPLAGRIITAGPDLRSHPVPAKTWMRGDGTIGGIDAANWIITASLRDSDNWFFDYQHESDNVAAMTLPHTMEKWFSAAGYSEIINTANVFFTQDQENAKRASDLRLRGYKVVIFIHSQMLYTTDGWTGNPNESWTHKLSSALWGPDQQDSDSWTPDHWVGLASEIKFIDDATLLGGKVECLVHSWGHFLHVPQTPSRPVSIKQFLANYYGFIACKH